MKDPGSGNEDAPNELHKPVSWSVTISAIYAVLFWVGIPVVTNLFPDSRFAKAILSIPSPWGAFLLLTIGLLVAYLLGRVTVLLGKLRDQRRREDHAR